MLEKKVFKAYFGDKDREVVISAVTAGHVMFHLYIDKRFICYFYKTEHSGWRWSTPNEEMQSADLNILIDMIEEHWGMK